MMKKNSLKCCLITLTGFLLFQIASAQTNPQEHRKTNITAMLGFGMPIPKLKPTEDLLTPNRLTLNSNFFSIRLLHNIHKRLGIEISYSFLNEEKYFENYRTKNILDTNIINAEIYSTYACVSFGFMYNFYLVERDNFSLLFRTGLEFQMNHVQNESINGYQQTLSDTTKQYYHKYDLDDWTEIRILPEIKFINNIELKFNNLSIQLRYSFARGNRREHYFMNASKLTVYSNYFSIGLGYYF